MAKDRLTDAQLRNQREQALRALRRVQRSVDTQLEVMERRMDRAILNKEKITIRLALSVSVDFKKFISLANNMMFSVADMIQIFLK
ncbi:hypothetical protein ES705_42917 [subsurface metagenome]